MERGKALFESEVQDLESRSRRAQEEIADLAVEAKSKDGLIHLVVGSQGRLHELTIDPRAKRLGTEVLAERIVEMVNDALDLVQQETAAKISAMFPEFPAGEFFGGTSQ
jgi:DNA-binding protein YbaB